MRNRYSRGEIARLYLDIVAAGVGVVGQVPTASIQRVSDGKWFQVSDGTWQATIVDNAMTETSAAFLPGRYQFDFNQSLDTSGSTEYIAKLHNASIANPVTQYEDLVFGAIAGTIAPALCAVQGTLYASDGRPARAELVRATLQPVYKDGLGRGIQSDRVILAMTNDAGDFSLSVVRGGLFRLEIPTIGYDRKVTIPDQATVLFTDL